MSDNLNNFTGVIEWVWGNQYFVNGVEVDHDTYMEWS